MSYFTHKINKKIYQSCQELLQAKASGRSLLGHVCGNTFKSLKEKKKKEKKPNVENQKGPRPEGA